MKNKKIYLVTGGCGFIGSALVRKLLMDKNNLVINIDKLSYASNIGAVENEKNDSYIFVQENITNEEIIKKLLKKYNPNFIIHLAAESHVDRSIDNPSSFIESNIVGTYTLLNECFHYWKNLNPQNKIDFKFLLVSTDEVYGSTLNVFTEESPMKPNSPYAASKASADLLARAWFKTYNFPVLTTNCSNNYGKWQFPEKLIPLVIKKCLENKKIPVYGKGDQQRDWLYVDDHIDALLMVLSKGKVGQTYNIASANEIKNLDLVKLICLILDEMVPNNKKKYSDLINFVEDRPGHDFRYSMNIDKIKKEINWEAKTELDEGLRKTIAWYLKNKSWLLDPSRKYEGQRMGKIKK